jgi:hypothetical protein
MITRITKALLTATLQLAWAMIHAGENAVMARSSTVASFWERVGNVGETLEAIVDYAALRCGLDMSAHMISKMAES